MEVGERETETPAGVKTAEKERDFVWRALCAAYIHIRGVPSVLAALRSRKIRVSLKIETCT